MAVVLKVDRMTAKLNPYRLSAMILCEDKLLQNHSFGILYLLYAFNTVMFGVCSECISNSTMRTQ